MAEQAHRGVEALRQAASEAPRPRAPRTQPKWMLKYAQDRQEQQEASARALEETRSMKRDDRLRIMEELDLRPGPIDFGRGSHAEYEPYSGQRLKTRTLEHKHFNEVIMKDRYHLTPSQLYSMRSRAADGQGGDGDYDVPVPGDFVVIATITSATETKTRQVDPTEEELAEPGTVDPNEMAWLDEADPGSSAAQRRLITQSIEKSEKWKRHQLVKSDVSKGIPFRIFEMQDLSQEAYDAGSKGCDKLKLMCWESKKVDGKWQGGSEGAFELLQAENGGMVVAIINPKLLKPYKKKPRDWSGPWPPKRKAGQEEDEADNDVMTIKPRDAESIIVLGRSKDVSFCTALGRFGETCDAFVDKRTCGRAAPICERHLKGAAERSQRGRQEFANGTSTFGKGGGFGRGGSWGRDRNGRWKRKKDDFVKKRKPLEGDATYGFHSNFGQTYVQGQGTQYNDSDPRSHNFSVSERYGREKQATEQRQRKRNAESSVLASLEANAERTGLSRSQDGAPAFHPPPPPHLLAEQDASGLPVSNSIAARAVMTAQRTVEERKEAARKKAAAQSLAVKKKREAQRRENLTDGLSDRARIFGEGDQDSGDDLVLSGPSPTTDASAAAATAGPWSQAPKPQGYRHSANAIKLMGFDPFSDSRSRSDRRDAEAEAEAASGYGSKNSLLARHKAKASDLGTPDLSLKRGIRNVRAPTSSRPSNDLSFANPEAARKRPTVLDSDQRAQKTSRGFEAVFAESSRRQDLGQGMNLALGDDDDGLDII